MHRAALRFTLVCGVVFVDGGALSAPAEEYSLQQRVSTVLQEASNRQRLNAFVGQAPERCVTSGAGTEVCEWWIRKGDPGWMPLARALEEAATLSRAAVGSVDLRFGKTRTRLSLICELPTTGAKRQTDSCAVYPRTSNRWQWKIRSGKNKSRRRERYSQRAQEKLRSARTLVELSRLVGAVPSLCFVDVDPGPRSCLWRTARHTWGHGTLATVIRASYRKKVRLRCSLPSDGSPRADGSCRVETGG